VDVNNTLGNQVDQQKAIALFTDGPGGESLAYSTHNSHRADARAACRTESRNMPFELNPLSEFCR
jgi:hypothetical protein